MCDLSKKLFPAYHDKEHTENQAIIGKKQAVINITEPIKNRQNIIYFGH